MLGWLTHLSFFFICTWYVIEDQHKSPDRGRQLWGNSGLSVESPPRKWKSMFDMTGGKSVNAIAASSPTKLVHPKTPTALGADRQIGSNRRTGSPSPLRYHRRYGIGILSQCFVMLPSACYCGVGGLKYTARDFLCTVDFISHFIAAVIVGFLTVCPWQKQSQLLFSITSLNCSNSLIFGTAI